MVGIVMFLIALFFYHFNHPSRFLVWTFFSSCA
jgi:hypothetical protein